MSESSIGTPFGGVLVYGNGSYGFANTIPAAKANFRTKGCGRLSDGYVIVQFRDDQRFAGISAMGYRWVGNATVEPKVTEVAPRKRAPAR